MMEQKKPTGQMDMKSLLMYNKLKYVLPSNLNVVERRQNKVCFADQNNYSSASGNELVIRLTSSTDYVYGPNCYLVFRVQTDQGGAGAGNLGFVQNTAMNLFSRLLFEDRSGAELERNDSLNKYVAQVCPWYWGQEYTKVGPAMAGQYSSGILDDPAVPNDYVVNGTAANYNIRASDLQVCIPLRYFMGIFNNETLIPSMLISGALIRLQLENVLTAVEGLAGAAAGPPTSFTISNPRIVLDSLALSPVIQKNLMEQSQSSGGLDYTYETVYYQSGNPGVTTNFNLQVNKAVARCQKLYWSAYSTDTPAQVNKQNLGTGKLGVKQLDYRLGDLYFPQRVISVVESISKNGSELYENSLQSVKRMRNNYDPPSITKNIFLNSGTALNAVAGNNDNNGKVLHVQSFEQSSALEYSGLAINNSRTLEARIVFDNPPAPQAIDAWICYLKLAKCNQIRTIIKE